MIDTSGLRGMGETTVTRPRGEYAAPVAAGVRSGRLIFERGTANDVIVVEPDLADLFVARFDGAVPRVETTAGTVRIRHARARRNRGRIALTGRLPWSLELHGGAARLRADLGGADITEITVGGGASHVDLALPAPTGCVPIRFGGGVSNVSVLRPKDVPVRLSMGGGAARIALDDQRFGAIGGPIALSSGCAAGAAGSYDIHIAGGAHALVIATY
jgi:hypothetical protein